MNYFTSYSLIGSLIGAGVFLFLFSFLGLCGALHHHQVMLFFVSFCNNALCNILEYYNLGIKYHSIFVNLRFHGTAVVHTSWYVVILILKSLSTNCHSKSASTSLTCASDYTVLGGFK